MFRRHLFNSLPVLAIICLIVSVLYMLDVFKPEPQKKVAKPKKIKVFVEQSQQASTPLFAYSQGEVRPKREIDIRSQVEGRLVYVNPNFVAGGRFKTGQTLMQIDKRDYELAVVQRDAAVARAKQDLARVEAQAAIAKAELDQLGREQTNDLARWVPQLERAKADLKAAEALLERAKLDLERTTLIAPFTGIVRRESVDVGHYVSRNNTLATMYAFDVMEVELALNGHQLDVVDVPLDFYTRDAAKGIPVTLTAEVGHSQLQWQGAIVRTEAAFDSRTRTLKAIAEVHQDNSQGTAIVPGLYVNAEIVGRHVPAATELARTTLRTNNKVWVVDDDNRLQIVSVNPVHRDHEKVVVTGLPHQSKVITSSLAIATPGTLVRPLNAKTATRPKKLKTDKQVAEPALAAEQGAKPTLTKAPKKQES